VIKLIQTNAIKIALLLSLLALSACEVVEKPQYFINDAPLRLFQSGDKVNYAVLDNTIFDYSITLTQKNEPSPDNNETLALLFEEQVVSDSATMPFLPQYYQQNSEGDLILKALGNGGEILWLVDGNDNEVNEILFPSDIKSLSTANNFNRKLLRCDQDQVCNNAGHYNLSNMSFIGTETAETAYANFEAYKLDVSVEIEILDAEQAGASKNYVFTGTAWIHPLIGIVKFLYNTSTPSNSSLLVGPLSNTNISIDESFKIKD